MLSSNLWVQAGLINGAMGTVKAIVYINGSSPGLPQAVMVELDHYSGPTINDGSVQIVPVKCAWLQGSVVMSSTWVIIMDPENRNKMVDCKSTLKMYGIYEAKE